MTNHSIYVFECPCGNKVKTRDMEPVMTCPKCGRWWSLDWAHEIEKAKAAGK